MPSSPQETAPAPPRSEGKPWSIILPGLGVVCVAGVIAAMLTLQFSRARPVNLRPHARQLAEEVHQVLLQHYIAPESIRRGAPIELQDARTRWQLHRFTVDVPPDRDPEGLRVKIRDALAGTREALVDAYDNPRDGKLSLAFAGRVFVELDFPGPPAEAERMDLRAACNTIAGEFDQLLVDLGVPREAITREEPGELEDESARWTFTRFRAALPAGLTLAAVEAEAKSRMARHTVTTLASSPTARASVLRIAYAGRDTIALEVPREARPAFPGGGDGREAHEAKAETKAEDESAETGGAVPDPDSLPLESNGMAEEPAAAPHPVPPAPRTGPAKVAIILDDGGYGGAVTEAALALDPRLTLAILPYTPHAERTAREAAALGFEVMLHMPMQANGNTARAFPGALDTSMDKETIQVLARNALEAVPGVAGVNNHTGARFTSDPEAMAHFLEVLQGTGLYFVDSRTIHTTIAYDAAREAGIPAAERDIFLDNKPDRDYIRGQLAELIERAKARGAAIGIGHFRKDTVAVLADVLPALEEEGVVLVHASELVE